MSKTINQVVQSWPKTIFAEVSDLCRQHDAINLGQGFPDRDGPKDIRDKAAQVTLEESNQYPPLQGVPELCQAVADHDKRFYGFDLDWRTQTLVTSGATEALTCSLMGLLNPGDEVVVFEPVYDSYVPIINLLGGVAKPVRLTPPDWYLSAEALVAAFSSKTKAVMLNSPMNPAGKVFSRQELAMVADQCIKHDAYAICDEVYEHLVFRGAEHIPLFSLPGMADRTIRIGSAGKIFSLTGWKIGFVSGAAKVVAAVTKAHQFNTFTVAPNLQKAVAYGLAKPDSYFTELAADMEHKRDVLAGGLRQLGFDVLPCDGTYFLTVDVRSIGWDKGDRAFTVDLIEKAGLGTIPLSPFYLGAAETNLVRFCFCKQESLLEAGLDRLAGFLG